MQTDHWFQYLQTLARRYQDRPALLAEGLTTPLTYGQLFQLASTLAHALHQRGITPGTPVMVCLPNTAWAPVAQLALAMIAACDIPIAYSATPQELAWVSRQAGTTWILTDRQLPSATDGGMTWKRVCPADLAKLQNILKAPPAPADRGRSPIQDIPFDISELPGRALPSSGTTGLPKISVYTHRSRLLAHRLQCELLPRKPGRAETLLLVTPFSHGGSLLAWAWWDAGGCVDLLPGLDTQAVIPRLIDGAGALFAPPTVLYKLLDAWPPGLKPSVHTVFSGTQRLDPALYRRARALFGPVMRITYGKSECINPICYAQPDDTDQAYTEHPEAPAAMVGPPAAGVSLHIAPEGASPASPGLPAGTPGTVWIQARHMSEGLWEQGQLRRWPDGWHDSSDRGYLDEHGRLWLMGRQGDAIKTGGYLVQLDDVEAIGRQAWPHRECAALAWPSAHWGAVVVLALTADDSGSDALPTRTEVRQAYANHAKALHPRLVLPVEQLTRNAQGKVQRAHMLASLMKRFSLRDGAYPSVEAIAPGTAAFD